jgi:hypothetical protein
MHFIQVDYDIVIFLTKVEDINIIILFVSFSMH